MLTFRSASGASALHGRASLFEVPSAALRLSRLLARRFFDLLRAVDADGETIKRVKAWILDEYRAAKSEAA